MSLVRPLPALLRVALVAGLVSLSSPAFAIFQNGGFEANAYTGWTVAGGVNPGLLGSPPFTAVLIIALT